MEDAPGPAALLFRRFGGGLSQFLDPWTSGL